MILWYGDRMNQRILIKCRVSQSGDFEVLQPDLRDKVLRSFKPGTLLYETLIPLLSNRQRSNRQNKYYWKVVVYMIADELGYLPEEAHEALKARFLVDRSNPALPRIKSTTELSVADFEYYLKCCRWFAADFLNIHIPKPNEVDY